MINFVSPLHGFLIFAFFEKMGELLQTTQEKRSHLMMVLE